MISFQTAQSKTPLDIAENPEKYRKELAEKLGIRPEQIDLKSFATVKNGGEKVFNINLDKKGSLETISFSADLVYGNPTSAKSYLKQMEKVGNELGATSMAVWECLDGTISNRTIVNVSFGHFSQRKSEAIASLTLNSDLKTFRSDLEIEAITKEDRFLDRIGIPLRGKSISEGATEIAKILKKTPEFEIIRIPGLNLDIDAWRMADGRYCLKSLGESSLIYDPSKSGTAKVIQIGHGWNPGTRIDSYALSAGMLTVREPSLTGDSPKMYEITFIDTKDNTTASAYRAKDKSIIL